MRAEVEAKFLAAGPEPLQRLASASRLGPYLLGPARTADEVDRYLDTADGRLAAARWACRLRSRDGSVRVSLKGPPEHGSGGWLHRRPEVEGPATGSIDPAAWPASDARAELDRLRGGRSLEEQLRLRQQRTERAVALSGGSPAILTLDRVVVERGEKELGTLHVVELELGVSAHADMSLLTACAEALHRIPGLRPDDRTKLEHALDLAR